MFEYIFYCRICLRNAIYRRNIVSRRSAYPHHRDGRSLHRPKRRYDWTNNRSALWHRGSQPADGCLSVTTRYSAVTNVRLGISPLLSSRQIGVPYDIVTHDLFGRAASNGRAQLEHAEEVTMLEHER